MSRSGTTAENNLFQNFLIWNGMETKTLLVSGVRNDTKTEIHVVVMVVKSDGFFNTEQNEK